MFRALGQLDDPALLRVLLKSVLLSAVIFFLLVAGGSWAAYDMLERAGLWAWAGTAAGALLGIVLGLWLFLPLAILVAGFFVEPVCRAVEQRWYPDLPPPQPAPLADQVTELILASLLLLLLGLVSLALSAVPVAGHLLGWAITAWALARGLFGTVALRRMSRRDALAAWRAERGKIILQGAALTLLGAIPLANLLLPVVGPAAMVHVAVRASSSRGPAMRAARPESWG